MKLRVAALLLAGLTSAAGKSLTRKVLDAMERNVTGNTFSEAKYLELSRCWHEISQSESIDYDPAEVNDAMFSGFVEWGVSGGVGPEANQPETATGADYWGVHANYAERNAQPMALDEDASGIPGSSQVMIQEPCNYNSNVAYYETVLSLCRGSSREWSAPASVVTSLAGAFNGLGTGSAWFHGSETELGCRIDNQPIAHIALTAYQSAVSALPPNFVVANDLPLDRATDGRTLYNGTEATSVFSQIFTRSDVLDWDQQILDLNDEFQSDYKDTFAALVTLIARVGLPKIVGDVVLPFLCDIMGFDDEKKDFLLNEYDVELRAGLNEHAGGHGARTNFPGASRRELIRRGMGVLLKMGQAMFWQEELFVGPWILSPTANAIGAVLMPFVNLAGDHLTTYEHSFDVKTGWKVYPNCRTCRWLVAHSKWHEQSSSALLDLVFLADDTDKVIRGANLTHVASHDAGSTLEDGSWVERMIESEEAKCLLLPGTNGEGVQCVVDLWFGADEQEHWVGGIEKCRGDGLDEADGFGSCLRDHVASAPKRVGVVGEAFHECSGVGGEGWLPRKFVQCVADKTDGEAGGEFWGLAAELFEF